MSIAWFNYLLSFLGLKVLEIQPELFLQLLIRTSVLMSFTVHFMVAIL